MADALLEGPIPLIRNRKDAVMAISAFLFFPFGEDGTYGSFSKNCNLHSIGMNCL